MGAELSPPPGAKGEPSAEVRHSREASLHACVRRRGREPRRDRGVSADKAAAPAPPTRCPSQGYRPTVVVEHIASSNGHTRVVKGEALNKIEQRRRTRAHGR